MNLSSRRLTVWAIARFLYYTLHFALSPNHFLIHFSSLGLFGLFGSRKN